MNEKLVFFPLFLFLFNISAALTQENKKFAPNLIFNSQKDKISYVIGRDIAKNIKSQEIDLNLDLLFAGIKSEISGETNIFSEQETQQIISTFQKEMQEKQNARTEKLTKENKKLGEKFLAENKKKKGVKSTPSGLQYKIIKEGKGPKPTINDTVTVNYSGTLINGTEFDSSYKRGQPATFPVNGVIKGWAEALQMMPVGSRWELYIPSDLAYGTRGYGNIIGPNETLIFDVELISIEKK